jgi:hypothetical protein
MEFRMHLGILILMVITMLVWWVSSESRLKKFKWNIPIYVGVFLYMVFEVIYWVVIYWVVVLCFL